MGMNKVSVVILTHNSEQYINWCLESVEQQTYGMENLEVILIDDCSEDNTLSLLQIFKIKYPNNTFILENESNHGASYSRMRGIEAATGEYLMFIDSDDWLDKYAVEKMVNKADELGCDFVECDFVSRNTREHYSASVTGESWYRNLRNKDDRKWYITHAARHAMWARLYRLTRLREEQITGCDGWVMGEDTLMSAQIILQFNDVYMLKENLYNVYVNENSVSRSGNLAGKMQELGNVGKKVFEILKDKGILEQVLEDYEEELGWYLICISYFVELDYWFDKIYGYCDSLLEAFPNLLENRYLQVFDKEHEEYMSHFKTRL